MCTSMKFLGRFVDATVVDVNTLLLHSSDYIYLYAAQIIPSKIFNNSKFLYQTNCFIVYTCIFFLTYSRHQKKKGSVHFTVIDSIFTAL